MATWDYRIFWDEAFNQLETEFKTSGKEQEFSLWFNIEYLRSEQQLIIISVPSAFYRDQLVSRGYIESLKTKLANLSGQLIDIQIEVKLQEFSDNKQTEEKQETPAELMKPSPTVTPKAKVKSTEPHPLLRTEYTFETFISGDNNSFAYNAALAVSKNPGKAYNPVLFYGGVGLGKTHLMQSIGNASHRTSSKKIVYITAESFTNEFVDALREKKMAHFRTKYRTIDILLVDDIHFLQEKEGIQEELFHTFNSLYDTSKQMVFTCDRPVSELKGMEDRLKTRFTKGLSIDLLPPKYETRRAILEKKLELMGKSFPANIIDLVAQNIETNVRDIEAALTKLLGYEELVGKQITLDIAQQQLRDIFTSPQAENISVETIQKVVADYFRISYADIKGKKKTKNIVYPRQLAIFLSSELTNHSTTELGIEFGGRDHSTIMHSHQKISTAIKMDASLDSIIQTLKRKIKDHRK